MAQIYPNFKQVQSFVGSSDFLNHPNAQIPKKFIPLIYETDLDKSKTKQQLFQQALDLYVTVTAGKKMCGLWETAEPKDKTPVNSIIACDPLEVLKFQNPDTDPIIHLEAYLKQIAVFLLDKSGAVVPRDKFKEFGPSMLQGAAVGYASYDCIRLFEPRVGKHYENMKDTLQLPDALFFIMNSFIYFDYASCKQKVIALCPITEDLEKNYQLAEQRIKDLLSQLQKPTPYISDQPKCSVTEESNQGREGYYKMVDVLRENIIHGEIIQAVPSHRIKRKTFSHYVNIYRKLRELNPSRYNFILNCDDFQLVGASPELLVQVENDLVITHPIAGTRPRGKTPQEDEELSKDLLSDEKERAEHIMLVDLGRNDVNRVCRPETSKVDSLMHIEYYSHVMHIVSQCSGKLRPECTSFDAFRSIFPAGTVSGAPKIRAMELVADLEKEKRGAYAGAVGYWSFNGDLDTCISIRCFVAKDDCVYLQAGGGIVYDSVQETEYQETVHKMGALAKAVTIAEQDYREPEIQKKEVFVLPEPALNSVKFSSTNSEQQSLVPRSISNANSEKPITLMIDNYDSFTWNVYQYLSSLGENVIVYRNDKISIEGCLALKPARLVISPGPSWPVNSGISLPIVNAFAGVTPILGVCMGHECIVEAFGGKIIEIGEIMHGKTSDVQHDGKGLYEGVPQNTSVIRYHSLAAEEATLPPVLQITSRTVNGIIMGVRHSKYRIEGIQYHPESIKSVDGMTMIKNFIQWTSPTW